MPEPIDKLRYACEDEAWALYSAAGPDLFLASIAVSLKRIADTLGEDSPFLRALHGTLDDASHNHQQRMRNV